MTGIKCELDYSTCVLQKGQYSSAGESWHVNASLSGVLITSLRNLCVLCVSAVYWLYLYIHRRDAEDAEITQRKGAQTRGYAEMLAGVCK